MAREFRVAVAAPNGNAGSPAFTFASDPNTGMYRAGEDTIGFSVGGSNVLSLYSGGALLIGTATATGDVIHQNGSGRATSMYELEVLSWM